MTISQFHRAVWHLEKILCSLRVVKFKYNMFILLKRLGFLSTGLKWNRLSSFKAILLLQYPDS